MLVYSVVLLYVVLVSVLCVGALCVEVVCVVDMFCCVVLRLVLCVLDGLVVVGFVL